MAARARLGLPAFALVAGLAIAGLALVAGCARKASEQGVAASADAGTVGSPAPAFELPDLDGKTVRLADFKGKVALVNFWATWCPPCRAEVPDFVRLQSKYRDRGFAIVGLSLDAGGATDVRPFVDEYNVNYTMLLANDKTAEAYGGIVGIPTTFILDRNGTIVKKVIGMTDYATVEQAILPLLQPS
ncbi:MAG: TlpA family protein disulfide reductase [Candidatus Latescibacteria bacterium]|nr:TlpA family protein disulfide reductase [Candidatus Latescibacterota bacterium]